MPDPSPTPPGVLDAVRRLGSTLLGILETRVSLLAVELEEERRRFLSLLMWAGGTLFFGMLAIVVVTATVVVLCPEGARAPVLIIFSLLYLGLAIGGGMRLRREIRDRPPPFSATTAELKKDAESLRGKK